MKLYVVIVEETPRNVTIHKTNSECAAHIIERANARLHLERTAERVDSLGSALRALENFGIDVETYPLLVEGVKAFELSRDESKDFEPAEELKKPDFDESVDQFLGSIRSLLFSHYTRNFPNLKVPTISVDPGGQKYLRVVRDDGSQRSVFCFVDRSNGDILKADGWKRPAKHARGSIYEDAGKGAITPYGVHYITSRGHRNR